VVEELAFAQWHGQLCWDAHKHAAECICCVSVVAPAEFEECHPSVQSEAFNRILLPDLRRPRRGQDEGSMRAQKFWVAGHDLGPHLAANAVWTENARYDQVAGLRLRRP
jgi:hypothetical protein